MTAQDVMEKAKDSQPVSATAAYYVHYRELDFQGGFWEVSPKGPYTNLNKARAVAQKMRGRDQYRGVRIVLRTEVEVSIIGGTWPV